MCLSVPGKLLSIEGLVEGCSADIGNSWMRSGVVEFGGVSKTVNLAYVPEAVIGDYVLVHAGFAIAIIDELQAQEVFTLLDQLEEDAVS